MTKVTKDRAEFFLNCAMVDAERLALHFRKPLPQGDKLNTLLFAIIESRSREYKKRYRLISKVLSDPDLKRLLK